MIELYPFQDGLVAELRAAIRKGFRSSLLVSPTGSGKTVMFAYLVTRLAENGLRSMIIAHRQELLAQISKTLRQFGAGHGFVAPGEPYLSKPLVHVASVFSLVRRLAKIEVPDYVIVDECFPAGTLVDGRPIESLHCGDMVRSLCDSTGAVELKRITRLFRKPAASMVTVHFDGGSIACTGNHPFYVGGKGYVSAIELQPSDTLLRVRGADPVAADSQPKSDTETLRAAVLLSKLHHGIHGESFIGSDGAHEPQVRIESNDCQEPHAQSGGFGEDESNAQGDRAQTDREGWQRQGNDRAASAVALTTDRVYARIHTAYRAARLWLSNALQNRFGESVDDGGDRSGRKLSRGYCSSRAGREKGCVFDRHRVDRVEVHKQGSNGGFGSLCSDGYVYNIEVDGNHNYFANGILVHNCHHAVTGSTWGKALAYWRKLNQSVQVIGVTATPQRLSGEGLRDNFSNMIMGPTVAELIDQGYLAKYKMFAPPHQLDTHDIHIRAGDFVRGEVQAAIGKPKIVGDAIAHYRKHLNGAPAIVFTPSVESAHFYAKQYQAHGYRAAAIDGTSNNRREIVRDFSHGRLNLLMSCDLISEGFDVPGAHGAQMLRPTESLALFLQQCGRVLRTAPGKEFAYILDHVGNSARHGLPDDDREWTLEGKKREGRADADEPAIRQCNKCGAVTKVGAAKCPECGYVFPVKARKVEEVDGELSEIDQARMNFRREQGMAKDLDKLIALGKSRGYRSPERWARHVFEARQNKRKSA